MLTSAINLCLLKRFTHMQWPRCALSQNGIFYYAMTYWFGNNRAWSQRIWLNFCWVSIFFSVLITNISRTVDQTPINQIIFWKSVMRTFRWIHVNCFNRHRSFAMVSTKSFRKIQKPQPRKITWTLGRWPHFFSTTFSVLTACNIHFCN